MDVREIPMGNIVVSAFNTRKNLASGTEDASIDDLAESIRQEGLLSPITVRTSSDGKFEIIAGQRRFLAFKSLGRTTIPAIVNDSMDDTDAVVVSLIENVHRADMDPVDKARAYKQLHDQYGTYTEVAKRASVSPSTVSRYMRLLDLAPGILDDLSTSDGPVGVNALSTLAQFFAIEDQEEARGLIAGLTLEIQTRIIRESGGNLAKLAELRDRALSGEFNLAMCQEGLCFHMSDELKAEVRKRLGAEV